jgi:hypothetical protein
MIGAMLVAGFMPFIAQAAQDPVASQNPNMSQAQTVIACENLKEQIEHKIISNGVKQADFTLEVVDAEQAINDGGKIVGSCNRGKQKIVYSRVTHSAGNEKSDK